MPERHAKQWDRVRFKNGNIETAVEQSAPGCQRARVVTAVVARKPTRDGRPLGKDKVQHVNEALRRNHGRHRRQDAPGLLIGEVVQKLLTRTKSKLWPAEKS